MFVGDGKTLNGLM